MALLPLRCVRSGLGIQSRADTKYGAGCHTADGIRLTSVTSGFGSLSRYLTGFGIHPRWLFGISEPSTVAWQGQICVAKKVVLRRNTTD